MAEHRPVLSPPQAVSVGNHRQLRLRAWHGLQPRSKMSGSSAGRRPSACLRAGLGGRGLVHPQRVSLYARLEMSTTPRAPRRFGPHCPRALARGRGPSPLRAPQPEPAAGGSGDLGPGSDQRPFNFRLGPPRRLRGTMQRRRRQQINLCGAGYVYGVYPQWCSRAQISCPRSS